MLDWCLKEGATSGLSSSFDGPLPHFGSIIDKSGIEPLSEALAEILFLVSVEGRSRSGGLEVGSGRW